MDVVSNIKLTTVHSRWDVFMRQNYPGCKLKISAERRISMPALVAHICYINPIDMRTIFSLLVALALLCSCEKIEYSAMPEVRSISVNGKPYDIGFNFRKTDTITITGDLHADAGIKFFNFFLDFGNGNDYFNDNVEMSDVPGMPLDKGFDSAKDHHFTIVVPPHEWISKLYWFYLIDKEGKTRAIPIYINRY